jgi:hypothetical protein
MRKDLVVPNEEFREIDGITSIDWKADPFDTLEAVDAALEKFGLEVTTFETGDDSVVFKVDKIEEPDKRHDVNNSGKVA